LYDLQAKAHGWHGHEALFGMMYDFIKPGQTLLDVGIGTGLSSVLFHNAGLHVSGFDSSREMLDMCEAKGFTVQTIQHDLRRVPYPYPAGSFDYVISLAVLNFVADLAPVFAEAARIVRPFGIFAFALEEQHSGQPAQYVIRSDPNAAQENKEMAIIMFRHSDAYVRSLLAGHGFTPLKKLEFLADRIPSEGIDVYFKAYVARKQDIHS
jgi:predicted TPR repeat methyltransferase